MDKGELNRLVKKTKIDQQTSTSETEGILDYVTQVAVGNRALIEMEDQILQAVSGLMNVSGVNSGKTTYRSAGAAQGAKQAYPQLHTTKKGIVRRNRHHQTFGSNFEMRRSNLIHIGTIDDTATDGRTEGYIELIEEEVMIGEVKKGAVKGLPKANPVKLHPTGVFSGVGARVLCGRPGLDPVTTPESDLVEVHTVLAPLADGVQRPTIEALDRVGSLQHPSPDDTEIIRRASTIRFKDQEIQAIQEMASIIDLIESHQNPQPPIAPPPPAAPPAPVI